MIKGMPSTQQIQPGRRLGRPPTHPPRKITSVRLELSLVAWMDAHLPRTVAVSDFVNEALREKIAKLSARGGA